jgi:LysM repeat protein
MPPQRFLSKIALAGLMMAPFVAASAQSLRGSPASVELMYSSAHSHDLAFLQNRADVYSAAMQGALVLISINEDLTLDRVTFPFVLPNTRRFADSLAKEYHAGCGERLEVTSGARPIDEQPRNASPKSVHPTGMAVDFHKPAGNCLTWLRKNLLDLEARGVVEATEEKHPAHFHVAVLNQLREPPIRLLASAPSTPATRVASAGPKVRTAAGEVALPPAAGKQARYQVRAGDNLWTIAERHNTTTDDLKKLNKLNSSRLKVGMEIQIR